MKKWLRSLFTLKSMLDLIPFTGPKINDSGAVLVWAQGGFPLRWQDFVPGDRDARPYHLQVSFTHRNVLVQNWYRDLRHTAWATIMFEAPTREALDEIITAWGFTADNPRLEELVLMGLEGRIKYIAPQRLHGQHPHASLS